MIILDQLFFWASLFFDPLMWVKLFAACSFMSFEFFWYLLISFDHMLELWTYPLHQVRMPRLLPKKAWLDWLDHGLGSVELLWNYVARPCKTWVDFFILLQSSSSWCSNMLKHVSRSLLIFAYLSLYLFMKCCILQSFSNMPASFTDMGISYTDFQCLFTMCYIQPFPHISTWLEQYALYKQPVSTMNIHEHGFKHGAGHSCFSPAKGKVEARRNSPNLWQMKAAAAEPIWVGNIQVMYGCAWAQVFAAFY